MPRERIDSESVKRSVPNYIIGLEGRVRDVFLKVLEGQEHHLIVKSLQRKRDLEKEKDTAARVAGFTDILNGLAVEVDGQSKWLSKYDKVKELYKVYKSGENVSPAAQDFTFTPAQKKFIELDAKLNMLLRQVRNATTHYLLNRLPQEVQGINNPDTFDAVIKRFKEVGVSQKDLDDFLNNNMAPSFSITAHPTDPTTVKFSQALRAFEQELVQTRQVVHTSGGETEGSKRFVAALQKVIDAPLVDDSNKSPLDELEETKLSLEGVWDSVQSQVEKLKQALENNGYTYNPNGISQLVYPSLWTLGDGDGNTNQNDQNLEQGILSLQVWTIDHYIKDLDALCQSLGKKEDQKALKAQVEGLLDHMMHYRTYVNAKRLLLEKEVDIAGIQNKLDSDKTLSSDLLRDLKVQLSNCRRELGERQESLDLAIKVIEGKGITSDSLSTSLMGLASVEDKDKNLRVTVLKERHKIFGMRGPTIDLRHNSNDIMTAVACIARQQGLLVDDEAEKAFKTSDMDKIIDLMKDVGLNAQGLEKIREKIDDSEYKNEHDLVQALQGEKAKLQLLLRVIPKAKIASELPMGEGVGSGQYYAFKNRLGDLRNIIDKLSAVEDRVVAQGTAFKDESAENQEKLLKQWLENNQINVESIKKACIERNELTAYNHKDGETAQRLLRRCHVMSRYPGTCKKLVIAEMKGAQNALGALFLLKASGNKVSEQGAEISITPLVESVPDLQRVRPVFESMYANELVRKHAQHCEEVILQIARSDTTRRAGRGAADIQDEAIKEFYCLGVELAKQYGDELNDVFWHCFQGGGFALQRGGGRVEETASKHMRAALRAGEELDPDLVQEGKYTGKMGRHLLTVQGHQSYLTFGAGSASNFMETMAAQNLYNSAKAQGVVKSKDSPNAGDREKMSLSRRNGENPDALKHRKKATAIMRDSYLDIMANPAVNELFKDGPWVLIKYGNSSSRASKRGDKLPPRAGKTAQDVCADGTRLFRKQRAIGTERLGAHSSTQWLSLLAVVDGLLEIEKQGDNVLAAMYNGSKSERDDARVTAIALAMTNFSNAWNMLCGRDEPTLDELKNLKEEFDEKYRNKKIDGPLLGEMQEHKNQCTLAYFHYQCLELARVLYKELKFDAKKPGSGELVVEVGEGDNLKQVKVSDILNNPKGDVIKDKDLLTAILHSPLQQVWPDMCTTLTHREQMAEFDHMLETTLTQWFNLYPNAEIPDGLRDVALHAYCGADVTNTPSGMLASTTRKRTNAEKWTKLHSVEELTKSSHFACGLEEAHRNLLSEQDPLGRVA